MLSNNVFNAFVRRRENRQPDMANRTDGTLAPAELLLSWPGLVPYVRLPKPGAIGTRGLFQLCNSSFESPWQLKLHSTSLNLQIGVVVEK